MGIKDFTKIFTPRGEIKLKDLNGKVVAIDASIEIFKACLGMSSTHTLTDPEGNPTSHINVMIYNIVKYIKTGVEQIWVFDNKSCAPLKFEEVARRRKRREEKQAELVRRREEDEFASDEECKLEKQCFSINSSIIADIKFILNCLNVKWCEAPEGYEAECVCAMMTNNPSFGAFAVISNDADALMFGARRLIRKSRKDKKNYLYDLADILNTNEITIKEFRNIGVIMGCDFCKKTPRIGAKTILGKFRYVQLTAEQKDAVRYFRSCPNSMDVNINNDGGRPNGEMVSRLMSWLIEDKGFSRTRMEKLLGKFL